eukprot:TRINITY_DN24270_c0_g1_i2.p1 TRINITY_DN24270_c0_g1~~TRINITY_DN24270_c0_g1_i2.p1  ORF type:complete len:887 (+),score=126.33 TRINITY_DN24270_c0_g1_i2:69-2729(+)
MLRDMRSMKLGLPDACPESYSVRFDSQRDCLGSLNSARRPREYPSTIENWLQSQLQEHGVETALPCAQRLHVHNQALALLADQVQHYRPLLLRVIDEVAANLAEMRRTSEANWSLRSLNRKLRADSESWTRESQYDYMSRDAQVKMMEASWHAEMTSKRKISGLQAENQKMRLTCQTIDKRGRLAVHRMKYRLQEALEDAHRNHETFSTRLVDTQKRLAETQSAVRHETRKNSSLSERIQHENEKNMSLSARIQDLEHRIQDQIDRLSAHKRKQEEMETQLEESRKELEHLCLLEQKNKEQNPEDIALNTTPEAIAVAVAEGVSESVRSMQRKHPHECTISIKGWFEVFTCIAENNKDRYATIKRRTKSGKAVQTVTLYDVDTFFVRPWTRKTGCGISLLMSRKSTAPAGMMLSHTWAEDMEELMEAVHAHVRNKDRPIPDFVRVWFCLFSLYQPGGEEGDGGPTITDQLRSDPFGQVVCSPSLKTDHNGYGMNVVHTSQADLYQRLWCVYELHCALVTENLEVTKSMSKKYFDGTADKLREWMQCGIQSNGDASPTQRREKYIELKQAHKTQEDLLEDEWETFLWIAGVKVKSATASCSSAHDKRKILSEIRSHYGGFDEIDKAIEAFRREQLEDDLDMMHKAIEADSLFYKFASDKLKKEATLAKCAVMGNGEALQYVPYDADGYRDIVLGAVKENGELLRFASEQLRGDEEVVQYAVQSSPKAIRFVRGDLFQDVVPLAHEAVRGCDESVQDELEGVIAKAQTERLQLVAARSEGQDDDPITQELAKDGKWAQAVQLLREHKASAKATETMMHRAEVHTQVARKTLKFVGQAIFLALSMTETVMDSRMYATKTKDDQGKTKESQGKPGPPAQKMLEGPLSNHF